MAEELNDDQLDELAAALQALRTELAADLEQSAAGAKPVQLDQQAIGRVSRMEAMQQQQMALANRRQLERRLELVKSALARCERGDYGFCSHCDEPIGIARLRARPETPICVHCQGALERD